MSSTLPSKPMTWQPLRASSRANQPSPQPTSRTLHGLVGPTASTIAAFVPAARLEIASSLTALTQAAAFTSQLRLISSPRSIVVLADLVGMGWSACPEPHSFLRQSLPPYLKDGVER